MAGVSLADATKEVARRDRVLAKAIARLGPLEHSPRDPDGPFVALPRAIVYHQLAGRAAQAIYTRVRATVGPGADAAEPRRCLSAIRVINTPDVTYIR
jgi:3-methyladenine DNA glycosylase/8-oxoguanine DNA glycosylase